MLQVRFPLFFLLVLMLVAAPGAAQGPDTPVSSDEVTVPMAAAAQPAQVAPGAEPLLAERAAPPRTLRAYWHVFIAFALTWVLLFGYAISVGRRLGGLEREVARLQRDLSAG